MNKKELLKELTEKYFYGNISVSFTLLSDDITKGEKPQGTPYLSRRGDFDENLKNAQTLSELIVEKRFGGYDRIADMQYSAYQPGMEGNWLKLYLPARTAAVLVPVFEDEPKKTTRRRKKAATEKEKRSACLRKPPPAAQTTQPSAKQ